jgi:hypothetical protein
MISFAPRSSRNSRESASSCDAAAANVARTCVVTVFSPPSPIWPGSAFDGRSATQQWPSPSCPASLFPRSSHQERFRLPILRLKNCLGTLLQTIRERPACMAAKRGCVKRASETNTLARCRLALNSAIACGIPHAGWYPKGRRALRWHFRCKLPSPNATVALPALTFAEMNTRTVLPSPSRSL